MSRPDMSLAVAALAAVLTLFGHSAAGIAAPRFGRPMIVASGGVPELSGPPSVAVDPAGQIVVAWPAQAGILVRRGSGGRLGATQNLGIGSGPHVSIAQDGTAAVIWQSSPPGGHGRRLVMAAIAPPGKPFGRPQRLLSVLANVVGQRIVATNSRVVAVWGQDVPGQDSATRSEIRYAIAAANTRFAGARTIAYAYYAALGGAVSDAAGDIAVAYQTPLVIGSQGTQAAAAVLPATSSTFDPSQVLSIGTEHSIPFSSAGSASVFSGPGGVAVSYNVEGTLPWQLQVSTLGNGLSFAEPQLAGEVPNPPPFITWFTGPVVALPSHGGPLVAWTSGRESSAEGSPLTGSLEAVTGQSAGGYSAPRQVSAPSTLSRYPTAAATSDCAILVWGEGAFDRERLVYSVREAAGAIIAPRTLATGVLREAALAGAGSHAVVAWVAGHRIGMAELNG